MPTASWARGDLAAPVPLGALEWTQLASAVLLFILAALLLWQNAVGRLHRAFALLLFLRGMTAVAGVLRVTLAAGRDRLLWDAMWVHFDLASIWVAVAFSVVVLLPNRQGDLLRLGLGAAAFATAALYAGDHCLVTCDARDGLTAVGPLGVLQFATPLAYAALALLLALMARRVTGAPARSFACVAFAFAFNAAFDGMITTAIWIARGPGSSVSAFDASTWATAAFAARALAALPAFATFALLLPRASAQAKRGGAALVLAAALTASALAWAPSDVPTFLYLAVGLVRFVMPAVVTYALLRHGLFDLDARIKRGVSHGTVVTAFVLVFVVGSDLAKEYVGSQFGIAVGAAAAGAMLFATRPLERLGNRMGNVLVPHARPPDDLTLDDRYALYRDQAELAWSDGALDKAERAMLDRLRDRLGLAAEPTTRIESEAAQRADRP